MRLGYEPIIFFSPCISSAKLLLDVQDVLFWTFGSFLMFGLLFRENNGTPRLFFSDWNCSWDGIVSAWSGKADRQSGFVRFRKKT